MSHQDVSSATLYVSAKLHDTIKKPQEILGIGYGVRFPNLVNAVTGLAEMDPEVLNYLVCFTEAKYAHEDCGRRPEKVDSD
jgi:hypothetical protein